MNSHIYNLQERTECDKVEPKLKLWIVNYKIHSNKGVAVVKARNPKEASDIFKADSDFNYDKKNIEIIRIEEIILDMTTVGLLAEEWV